MMRVASAAVIAGLVAMVAPAARGVEPPPPCCACVPGSINPTSTNGGEAARVAFFCAEGMTAESEVRCGEIDQMPPAVLLCLATAPDATAQGASVPGSSCRERLAGEGIICPAAGAPAAAPLGLGLLALGLCGLGATVLQRHASRSRA
jgi:hypothetical protein